jgi:hypothetical protein
MAERIVEVEWEDANSGHGWLRNDELPRLLVICSLGSMIRDDKEGILLVESWAKPPVPEGQKPYGCATLIPRSAIRKVTELKHARSR